MCSGEKKKTSPPKGVRNGRREVEQWGLSMASQGQSANEEKQQLACFARNVCERTAGARAKRSLAKTARKGPEAKRKKKQALHAPERALEGT